MYIYKTILFTNTTNVVGAPASNTADLADFETNKASTYLISEITVAETSATVEKNYAQFKALIVSPILWADVKRIETNNTYELYLLSENPL